MVCDSVFSVTVCFCSALLSSHYSFCEAEVWILNGPLQHLDVSFSAILLICVITALFVVLLTQFGEIFSLILSHLTLEFFGEFCKVLRSIIMLDTWFEKFVFFKPLSFVPIQMIQNSCGSFRCYLQKLDQVIFVTEITMFPNSHFHMNKSDESTRVKKKFIKCSAFLQNEAKTINKQVLF